MTIIPPHPLFRFPESDETLQARLCSLPWCMAVKDIFRTLSGDDALLEKLVVICQRLSTMAYVGVPLCAPFCPSPASRRVSLTLAIVPPCAAPRRGSFNGLGSCTCSARRCRLAPARSANL